MVRAPFYDENGVKKGAWSAEEDKKLKAYVEKHGHWNWRELPKFAGLSRCGKSCRLRWINYLRPDVKRGNYSKEEEELILKLHQEHGNKWSLIAAQLPGRTDNEIKNYWHTRLKKLNRSNVMRKQQNEVLNSKPIKTRASDIRTKMGNEFPSHQILESFPLSPLSSELSNVFSNHEPASSTDMVAEDSLPTFTFEEADGDFWAQPFLADSEEVQSEDSMFFTVGGFNPAAYNLVFDNDEDLLCQVMKELPENYQSQFYQ